jgi:hypothetical protein
MAFDHAVKKKGVVCMKNEKIVMTKAELEELIFSQSSRASNNLYKGLCRAFLDQYNRDFETIIKELDYIKLCLRYLDKKESE